MSSKIKKIIKAYICLLILTFCLAGCGVCLKKPAEDAGANIQVNNQYFDIPFYLEVNPGEAIELINNRSDLIIIDVSDQYSESHLARAINIPISELENKIIQLDKAKSYLVYGRSSAYSVAGASRLAESGFENIYRLDGELSGWISAGLEVVK